MRSLKVKSSIPDGQSHETSRKRLQKAYHAGCIFKKNSLLRDLRFRWGNDGALCAEFFCTRKHQGYDDIAHGGVIAAIVDASMTQCLMGHGIAGYTGELNVRYRTPVKLNAATTLQTRLVGARFDKMYQLEAIVTQEKKTCVTATSKFFKISQ
jgi:acyl-coenzyme A thioesterase PaaI-like protein